MNKSTFFFISENDISLRMGLSMGRREYIRLLKQKRYSIYKCKKWYVVLLGTERVRENKKENNMMCNFAPLIRM